MIRRKIWKLRKNSLKDAFQWILGLAALGVSLFLPWINAIFVILACGLLGIFYYYRRFKQEGDGTPNA